MADRIQLRRDTKANWESYNPILLEGEPGHVLDYPNLYKMGDGVHNWNDLPYRGYNGNVTQDIQDDIYSVPSNAAIYAAMNNKIDKINIVQKTGQNTDKLMSQKAISDILNSLRSSGYLYVGIATTETNPGTPTEKVFYIAKSAGTYTNFGSLILTQGINILKFNGTAWSVEQVYGVDDEPTAGSDNLVKSGGVENKINDLFTDTTYLSLERQGGTTTSKFFWNSNGGLGNISTTTAASCFEAITVDVSEFVGESLSINVNSGLVSLSSNAYCLFVDAQGTVIERWQQNSVVDKIVPVNAKYAKLSNMTYDFDGVTPINPNPYVLYGEIVSIEELQDTVEELQDTVEELQSNVEELQDTVEEIISEQRIDLQLTRQGGTTTSKFFWNSNGALVDMSGNHKASCFEAITVDVSEFVGESLSINVNSAIGISSYCLFVDSQGAVLERWQQNSVVDKIVPVNAKYAKLSNMTYDFDGVTPINPNPYVIAYVSDSNFDFDCPDVITSYVGDTIQLFKYPLLKSSRKDLNINIFSKSNNRLGKDLGRYFEFIPTANGTYTIGMNILSQDLKHISSKEISISVITPSNPSSVRNILFIGDSETQGTVNNSGKTPDPDSYASGNFSFTNEVKAFLTTNREATDILPAGLNLSNFRLIGTKNTANGRNEAVGGWNYNSILGSSSPFYIGGQIDLNAYLSQDTPYDDTNNKGLSLIYILLGANETIGVQMQDSKLTFDTSSYKNHVKSFLDIVKGQLITDSTKEHYNPNLKVVLLGYAYSWLEGYAYHPYGSGQYTDGTYMANIYAAISQANDEICALEDYSDFCSSVRIAPFVDSENCYCWFKKQKNRYMAETEKVYLEAVHPNQIGYKMYAGGVVRDIISR